MHGISIDAQEQECREAVKKEGYDVLEVIKDEGRSGGNLNRPGIRRIKELVEQKAIEAIFMVHADRLARNTVDHITMMDFFDQNHISIHFVHQQSVDRSTASGYMQDTLFAAFNDHYRRTISEKTLTAMTAKVNEGWFSGTPPIGYKSEENPLFRKGEISRHRMVVDEMGPLVMEAFQLYATGNYNGAELNDLMYDKGLRTKRGNKLHLSILFDMLENPLYIGELHWRDKHILEAKHKPLTDRDTFNRVQNILAAHANFANRRRKFWFLLRGLVLCTTHRESHYTAEWHQKKSGLKFAYYHCANRNGCESSYIEISDLENQVAKLFEGMKFSEQFIAQVIAKAKQRFEAQRQDFTKNTERLVAQRRKLFAKRSIVEDKLFKGVITDDDFSRIREEIGAEIVGINREITNLERKQNVDVDTAKEALRLIRNVYDAYVQAPLEIKKLYLSIFFKNLYVSQGKIDEVVYSDLIKALITLRQITRKRNFIMPKNFTLILLKRSTCENSEQNLA